MNFFRKRDVPVESAARELARKIAFLSDASARKVSKEYEHAGLTDIPRRWLKLTLEGVCFYNHVACRLASEVFERKRYSRFVRSLRRGLTEALFETQYLDELGNEWKRKLRARFDLTLTQADEDYSKYEMDLTIPKNPERSIIYRFGSVMAEIFDKPDDIVCIKLGVDIAIETLPQLGIYKILDNMKSDSAVVP